MVQVNPPPQLRIPDEFLADKATRAYFENLNFTVFQLWLRSGGSADATDDKTLNPLLTVGFEEGIEALQNNILHFPVDFTERLEALEDRRQIQRLGLEEDVEGLLAIPTTPQIIDRVEEIIIVVADVNYTQLEDDDMVFMAPTVAKDFNLLPQAQGFKRFTLKNEGAGTITIVPSGAETAEITSLSPTTSVTLVPRGASFSWSSV